MLIEIARYNHGPNSTIGLMAINGQFECYTCEDEHRDIKIPGRTRIPEGSYRVLLRDAGKMNTLRFVPQAANQD